MKIFLTGSHGLVGQALIKQLTPSHELLFFSRPSSFLDLPQVDAIIHLSGENIAGRWSRAKKRRIKESRCDFTDKLVSALIEQRRVPKVFLSASAIGFYGNRGDELLDERARKGEGFLSDICACWENASRPLAKNGARVAHMRFGMVLSKEGGALKKMMLPFQLGLGGCIGSGEQYISWIAIQDLTAAIEFILKKEELSGPINLSSPNPVTNLEFSTELAHSFDRTLGPPLPKFLARWIFGEMADALLLASTRAHPKKLLDAGFSFRSSLRSVLGLELA